MNISSVGNGWPSYGNKRQSQKPGNEPKETKDPEKAQAKWKAVLEAAMKDGGPVTPVKVRPRED